jgi:hypothetical protein
LQSWRCIGKEICSNHSNDFPKKDRMSFRTSGHRFLIIFILLASISLACGLSTKSQTSTLPATTPLVVTVVVTATPVQVADASPPTEAPSLTPVPPTLESSPTQVPPTLEPSPTQIPPTLEPTATLPAASPYAPVGFVADPHDGVGLTFFNLDGSLITELVTPGLSEYDSRRVHIAGPWKGDLSAVPVVFFSAEGPSGGTGTEWLRIVAGNADPVWISVSQFFAMAGASGQPVLAYSTLDYEQSQPRSRLYAGSLQNLPGASPLFNIADPDGYMVRPLAVDAEAGVLKGVWYTMVAWGIGGDIVFEPRKGMKYLDMTNGMVSEILNRDMVAWDVSPDRTWVAYSTISGPVSVLNRLTGEAFTYPLLPDSNRGAGNACISPDGLYVAWMEGSGWMMAENPDFHASIRIATTAGVHFTDIPQTAFDNIASSDKISWIQPVGWLDGQTLIVQARFQDWSSAALLGVNFDGSNPLYLATGTFVTFLYP